MAILKETRTATTNTLEEWRTNSNEISLHLGDTDALHVKLADKVYSTTATANQASFSGTRFELSPENTLDNTAGWIILKNNPTMTGFVLDTTIFQGSNLASADFKGTIEGVIGSTKILLKNVTGTYSAAAILKNGTQTITAANQSRLVTESYPIGVIRVYNGATEMPQTLVRGGFNVVNHQYTINLTGSPTIPASYTEGATLFQGSNDTLANATWSGTLYDITQTTARLKTNTGTFSATTLLRVNGNTGAGHQIAVNKITSGAAVDYSFGSLIEFHTPAAVNAAIKIKAPDLVAAINELQGDIGTVESLTTSATDLQSAVNEHDAELGTITAGALGTSASTVSTAIAEHETQIGNTAYGTNATTITAAIKEHGDELGTITAAAMGTTASTVGTAIAEHETQIGNVSYTTTAQTLTGALAELETASRAANSNYTLTTTAPDFRTAINELDAELGTITAAAMGTTASTVGSAIAEHQADLGTVASLTTSATSVVTAINELDLKQGAANLATSANTLSGAINELHTESDASVRLTSGSTQALNFNMTYGSNGKSMTFASGTTLDLSNGTLLLSAAGNVANFGSAFLNLNATASSGSNVNQQGLQVDRTSISGGAATHDVRLQWNETRVSADPEEAWELIGMTTSGAANTTSVLTRHNAFNLFANNAESGINATWDSTNQNVDFNVDDFTVTLGTGPISGNVTITDLANATFNTTLDNNSVALGTHTTGNYMSGISGTANEITVTHTAGEGSSAVIALPDDVTIGNNLVVTDYLRTAALRVGTTGADPGDNALAVNGNAAIAGNTVITGNLTVNGTQTTLSTATLEVEDTLVLVGSDLGNTNEPSTGGFGLETRKFSALGGTTINSRTWESDGTHPNAASNVDGSHSIVYNFTTDRWEADGSLILSSATLGSPKIEGQVFEANDNLLFAAGSGLTEAVTVSGINTTVTYVNADKGSSQNIFKNFTADSGGTAAANTNDDTIDIAGGTSISTIRSGDTITVNHDDTSSQASVDNANGNVIQDVTLDTHGHVTGLTSLDLDGRYYRENEFTSANTVSKPVIRDSSGDFSARIISATTFSGTATNASLLDNIDSTAFLRSDTADTLGAVMTIGSGGKILMGESVSLVASNYGHGVFGLYSATKYQHVWSMGAAYKIDASGSNLGNLYGLAWTHSNVGVNYAGGHQMLLTQNGTPTAALGTNIWTSGTVTASGGNSSNWNSAYASTNAAVSTNTASRLVIRDSSGNFSAGTITASLTGTASNISSQANSATITAATGNTANTIVQRDGSGNFTAGTITAALTGNASTASSATSATYATKVTFNTQGDTNTTLKVLLGDTSNVAVTQGTVYKDNSLSYNVGSNTLFAAVFSGALSGNATSATTSGSCSGNAATISSQANSATTTHTSGNTANQIVSRDGSGNFIAGTITAALTGAATSAGTAGSITSQANSATITASTAGTANQIVLRDGSGNANAVDFIASSDNRLKSRQGNIEDALNKVEQLNGFVYKWNDEAVENKKATETTDEHIGVSAQEVNEILPQAVNEGEDGYLGVKYDKLTALLIEAVKELSNENKLLRSDIEDLKSINS